MAQPTPYSRAYAFADYQSANPAEPLPGDQVDAELDAVERSIDGLVENIGLVQADDGGLQPGIVDYDACASDVKVLLAAVADWNLRGAWATATDYAKYDVVIDPDEGRTAVCAVAHTSGTFSTDATAGKWAYLTAEQGPTGPTGPTGDTGATGATGAAGADGAFTDIASQAEAATATDNTKGMTPLRVDQEINARVVQGFALYNGYISASVAANALTITLKTLADATPTASAPIRALFPDETLATGKPDFLTISSATSLVVPDTATLGATNGVPFTLTILLFNDGQIGVVNLATRIDLTPGSLKSPTAVSTGADSAGVIYTTSGLTSKPFIVLGHMIWSSGLTTAGTWDAAPTTVHQQSRDTTPPSSVSAYIHLEDQKADGTAGDAVSTGAWTKLTLNTEVSDTQGLASLSSSVIALAAGTYDFDLETVTHQTGGSLRLRLRNTTDNADLNPGGPGLVVSQGAETTIVGQKIARLRGRFTITGTKNIEAQYFAEAAGTALDDDRVTAGVEVYTVLTLYRLPIPH